MSAPKTLMRLLCALALSWATPSVRAAPPSINAHAILRLPDGLVLPYPLDNLFRGWTECTRRGHHKALDIGGVGPNAGLGTPIYAMAPARVISIGLPAEEPERFGAPLDDCESTTRSRRELPTHAQIEPYGEVYFFTKSYGRHRSGAVITLKVTSGPLDDHTLRYMHLAAVHPALAVGTTVHAGQEIGLMGGTAVQQDSPHLHLGIESPKGKALDVGRILGIGSTRVRCRAGKAGRAAVRSAYQKRAHVLMRELRAAKDRIQVLPDTLPRCGSETVEGGFDDDATDATADATTLIWPAPTGAFGEAWTITIEPIGAKYRPKLVIMNAHGTPYFNGYRKTSFAPRKVRFDTSWKRKPTRHMEMKIKPVGLDDVRIRVEDGNLTKRQRKDARWRLTVDRPCPEIP